jgi:hypothetical protein
MRARSVFIALLVLVVHACGAPAERHCSILDDVQCVCFVGEDSEPGGGGDVEGCAPAFVEDDDGRDDVVCCASGGWPGSDSQCSCQQLICFEREIGCLCQLGNSATSAYPRVDECTAEAGETCCVYEDGCYCGPGSDCPGQVVDRCTVEDVPSCYETEQPTVVADCLEEP